MTRIWTLLLLILSWPTVAVAQDRTPSHCIALAGAAPGLTYIHTASYTDPVPAEAVRISYVDHAMFLIQTTGGLSVMTDFTGRYGAVAFTPDVVTMNNAHGTHFTRSVDPAIPHPLEGWWQADGKPADHYLDLGEMLVRNVTTDLRSGDAGALPDANSIFVFEVAGLCIGHLGHLHHEPTPAQYAALGRMDVVMAAVDGGRTVDLPTMIRILQRLRSSVVIPMHWFDRRTLDAFVAGMQGDFAVERTGRTDLIVSLDTLPDQPTVMVLEPRLLSQ